MTSSVSNVQFLLSIFLGSRLQGEENLADVVNAGATEQGFDAE